MKYENLNINEINIQEDAPPERATEQESKQFLEKVAEKVGITVEQATVATAIICQRGGTAKKAQGTINVKIENKTVSLNALREIIKTNKFRITLRQWARANADLIFQICEHFSIPGDLSKKISRNHNEITDRDMIWLSNFQMDNPQCPDNLRQMLMEHYSTLFPGKNINENKN
jgi:hypothetical protein